MGESGAELSHGGVMILLMLILLGFVNECLVVAVILILIVTVCVLSGGLLDPGVVLQDGVGATHVLCRHPESRTGGGWEQSVCLSHMSVTQTTYLPVCMSVCKTACLHMCVCCLPACIYYWCCCCVV